MSSFIPPGEKIIETKKCRLSGAEFVVTDKDLEFYDKISPIFSGQKYQIPSPTLCPEERQRRRLCFRNERKLYKRKCNKTGKEIVSIYSPDKPHTVYDQKIWWGDDWSASDYGIKFDFERRFFEQFRELFIRVPLLSTIVINSENSEYSVYSHGSKNVYLSFRVGHSQDVYYSYHTLDRSDHIFDCTSVFSSTNCYECVECEKINTCFYCQRCENSRNLQFCYGCIGCNDCCFCVQINNKQYCFENKQYTKSEYQNILQKFFLPTVEQKNIRFQNNKILHGNHRNIHKIHSENCRGDNIISSKNVFIGWDIYQFEDAKYLSGSDTGKNVLDGDYIYDKSSWCIDQNSTVAANNSCFSYATYNSSQILYSIHSNGSNNLFGCSQVRRGSHCILNIPYSVHEYENLCGKIIDHMRSTGEWGEFFPHELSPFGYNETVANEYFRMTQEEVKEKGWNWYEGENKNTYMGQYYLPLPISEYNEKKVGFEVAQKNIDEVLSGIIKCEVTGKPFKIIRQELAFYIENGIPLPNKHPDQRHKERMDLRNPRKLFERKCDECGCDMVTTYAPDRKEKVVCEECYRKLVY